MFEPVSLFPLVIKLLILRADLLWFSFSLLLFCGIPGLQLSLLRFFQTGSGLSWELESRQAGGQPSDGGNSKE